MLADIENAASSCDDHAQRSTSSAMPDLSSPNVPCLKARVHANLTPADCAKIPLSSLNFRPLATEDYDEMVALHTEWFPVSYDEAFFTKSVQGEIFTLVATHRRQQSEQLSCLQGGVSNGASSSSSNYVQDEEHLLGIVTMSTRCEHHSDDIPHVLGGDCATFCRKKSWGKESNCVLDDENGQGCIAYILTLGVVDGFRRRGLARELLTRSVQNVQQQWPHVQAVYLHVVTYNDAAIKLYEANQFVRIKSFPNFYLLHGKLYDSYLYAQYVNGGRPPWKWRLLNFFNIGLLSSSAPSPHSPSAHSSPSSSLSPSSWRSWVRNAWISLWGGDSEKRHGCEEP